MLTIHFSGPLNRKTFSTVTYMRANEQWSQIAPGTCKFNSRNRNSLARNITGEHTLTLCVSAKPDNNFDKGTELVSKHYLIFCQIKLHFLNNIQFICLFYIHIHNIYRLSSDLDNFFFLASFIMSKKALRVMRIKYLDTHTHYI